MACLLDCACPGLPALFERMHRLQSSTLTNCVCMQGLRAICRTASPGPTPPPGRPRPRPAASSPLAVGCRSLGRRARRRSPPQAPQDGALPRGTPRLLARRRQLRAPALSSAAGQAGTGHLLRAAHARGATPHSLATGAAAPVLTLTRPPTPEPLRLMAREAGTAAATPARLATAETLPQTMAPAQALRQTLARTLPRTARGSRCRQRSALPRASRPAARGASRCMAGRARPGAGLPGHVARAGRTRRR
jgi:hypothetical protein